MIDSGIHGENSIHVVHIHAANYAWRKAFRLFPRMIFALVSFFVVCSAFLMMTVRIALGMAEIYPNVFLLAFVIGLITCNLFWATLFWYRTKPLFTELREERMKTVNNLRNFDVRNTEATEPADKEFVLNCIREMHGSVPEYDEYGQDVRLKIFNERVKKFARRVDSLLKQVERQLTIVLAIVVEFCVMGVAFVVCLVTGLYRPFIMPSLFTDISEWLAPDACILNEWPKWCHDGHHAVATEEVCVDGEAARVGANSTALRARGCFYVWRWHRVLISFAACLLYLGLTAKICLEARKQSLTFLYGGHWKASVLQSVTSLDIQQSEATGGWRYWCWWHWWGWCFGQGAEDEKDDLRLSFAKNETEVDGGVSLDSLRSTLAECDVQRGVEEEGGEERKMSDSGDEREGIRMPALRGDTQGRALAEGVTD
mmetsp:Transcript_17690/g.41507  ORF Transcript_17690/g.41507 Transcript_17690/m.41507 type:complete len:427 (+) Transcript_17690:2-1282(+)